MLTARKPARSRLSPGLFPLSPNSARERGLLLASHTLTARKPARSRLSPGLFPPLPQKVSGREPRSPLDHLPLVNNALLPNALQTNHCPINLQLNPRRNNPKYPTRTYNLRTQSPFNFNQHRPPNSRKPLIPHSHVRHRRLHRQKTRIISRILAQHPHKNPSILHLQRHPRITLRIRSI